MVAQSQNTDFDFAHTYLNIPFTKSLLNEPTIISYMLANARSLHEKPFITEVASIRETKTLTYASLNTLSSKLAGWLIKKLELNSHDIVAVMPANDIESVLIIFSLLRIKCSILLLNPTNPTERLQQQAKSINAKHICRASSLSPEILPSAISIADPHLLPDSYLIYDEPTIDPYSDALFFGTSGSTAISKIVSQSHYNIVVNAEALRLHHNIQNDTRLLGCLPIYHVNGLHFTIFATLLSGSQAILLPKFDPFTYHSSIEQFKPHIASVVPSILEGILDLWRNKKLPDEFRYFVSAAAPITTKTVNRVFDKIGAKVLQGYGLTETTNFSAKMPTDISDEMYKRYMLNADIPSIGVACFGNEVAVLDEHGNPVKPGEIGELCMRGHNVMTRYVGNAEATKEAFLHGWFHSQDIGFYLKDEHSGRDFFFITGRSKNIAKVQGESVSLEEMERVIIEFPNVSDVACISLPHRIYGEEIVVAVVFSNDASSKDKQLISSLRNIFSPIVLPRKIIEMNKIPRTQTGKILRPELLSQVKSGLALIDRH